jgi:hypothetical protein
LYFLQHDHFLHVGVELVRLRNVEETLSDARPGYLVGLGLQFAACSQQLSYANLMRTTPVAIVDFSDVLVK